MSGHSFAESWLAREDYRVLRQVERELYPSLQTMRRERSLATPRRKTEPTEGFRAEATPGRLVTNGG